MTLLFYHMVQFYFIRSKKIIFSALIYLVLITVTSFFITKIDVLKIKNSFDFVVFFFLLFYGATSTTLYLLEKNKITAFLNFLFFSHLFTYSFVGEKVPWLFLYPFVTSLILFAYIYKDKASKYIYFFSTITIGINIYVSYLTVFKHHGKAQEFLSQVHTSREFENIYLDFKNKKETFKVLTLKEPIWPSTWFGYGENWYSFSEKEDKYSNYDYIITPRFPKATNKKLLLTHKKDQILFRYWWVPNFKKLTVMNWFKYYLHRQTWNPTGSQYMFRYTRLK